MSSKFGRWRWLVAAGALAVAAVPLWGAREDAGTVEAVRVENFPEVQEVRGVVRVGEPIPHASFMALENHSVPGGSRVDPRDLLAVGRVATDGYTRVVLSLTGEVGSRAYRGGRVGAILVPDVEPIDDAFLAGDLQHTLTVTTTLPDGGPPRYTAQTELPVAFPAYRVYLFNELDAGVRSHLYVYRTQ